ncbi:unnamed protein product [Penicillium salamii]|nr:unnamed protein product [Penicillium salamii]CAG7978128.1 unnamed protein product [Penicillium salamii]
MSPQGSPNRSDPSPQTQGRALWYQPSEHAPSPVCVTVPAVFSVLRGDSGSLIIVSQYLPTTYPPPPKIKRGYHQYSPSQYPPPNFGRQQRPSPQRFSSQYASSGYTPLSNTAAIHAHQRDASHRLPPPPGLYCRPGSFAQGQAPQGTYQAAAPRQRTAVACQYCRRRKRRCSGFETSADGRCNNCLKFDQDCNFIPLPSQTKAFVPAQAAYPHLRTGPIAYPAPGPEGTGGCDGPPVQCGTHIQPLFPQKQPQEPETILPPPQWMVPAGAQVCPSW